jgi:group I intron endonuclease
MSGVYQIKNKTDEKKYIGSSKRLNYRIGQHKSDLRANRHINKYLQNAWNKYGEDNFEFEILEQTCDIIEAEQKWIDLIKPEYNIQIKAFSGANYSHTESAKVKIGLASKKRWQIRREEFVKTMTLINRDTERNERRSLTISKKRSEKYQGLKLINSNGEILVINGSIRAFAKRNQLHYSTLHNVLNEKSEHVLGWRLLK